MRGLDNLGWFLGMRESKLLNADKSVFHNGVKYFFCNLTDPKTKELLYVLRIYQCWKFHHTVIETCFEMLKSSEHEKSWRYSSYKSLIFFSLFWNFLHCHPIQFTFHSVHYPSLGSGRILNSGFSTTFLLSFTRFSNRYKIN